MNKLRESYGVENLIPYLSKVRYLLPVPKESRLAVHLLESDVPLHVMSCHVLSQPYLVQPLPNRFRWTFGEVALPAMPHWVTSCSTSPKISAFSSSIRPVQHIDVCRDLARVLDIIVSGHLVG
jgi:hypothetical protein